MAALVHLAAGFASKPFSREVPVWVLVAATEVLDILAILFGLAGIESTGYFPWSHGLVMSLAWSVVFGVACLWIFQSRSAGLLIGCLIFSHWIIDFITHPMGAVFGGRPLEPDLPLLFGGSKTVGLGLYNHSIVLAYVIEYGTIVIGVGIYVLYTLRQRHIRKAGGA